MNKDAKVLLIALVIIIVGALSFNYTNITGKTTSDYTTITISPNIVKAGEYINLDINPGLRGVFSEIEVYISGKTDIVLSGYSPKMCKSDPDDPNRCSCSSNKCYEITTVPYKIPKTWDNNGGWDYTTNSKTYYARVYDIYSGLWVKAHFTVERFYEARGPDEHR